MRIGILGTGMVGQALAADLAGAGHQVVMGTRDPDARHAPEGVDLVEHEAACDADLVINALNGQVCLEVVSNLHEALAGKVLLDVANPLDFSAGFPPTLFTAQTNSLGEQHADRSSDAASQRPARAVSGVPVRG
jgi:predicted dinucleotide-binding enzyme